MLVSAYPRIESYKKLIECYMEPYVHHLQDTGYGWRRHFENKMRFDLIDYRNDQIFIRVGRGAWLVETYPILHSMFDQVQKVVAKFEIHGLETLEQKWFWVLVKLLSENAFDAKWNLL